MRFRQLTIVAATLNALLFIGMFAQAADPIPGIGPDGEVQKLFGDLGFTEGPAADGQGNLYFTDIPANRIHKVNADGDLSVFLEPSGHCNGVMLDAAGTLYACSMDGRLISVDVESKQVTALADSYDGKRFNAPNDLVIDRTGGIYFTDPRFRAPNPWPQGKEAVYYRAPDGAVTRLADDHPAPNGVILSLDEQKLYVIPSMEKRMWEYQIEAPGKLGPRRLFCELVQPEGATGAGGGGDGLTIDSKGNLYITSRLGVQVFDPTGGHLGIIEFPEVPANVTFGGKDLQTLYVTARTSLYAVKMQARGHLFPGAD